jgi:hypothetical protein
MAKTKKPFYKKWWVWVIAIIVVFGATGGDDEQPASTDVKNTEQPAPKETKKSEPKEEKADKPKEEAPKVAGIGEEVKVGDVVFIVHGTETAKEIGNQYVNQTAQGTYLIADVTVKNAGKEAITTDSSFFKLKSGDAEYESDGGADMYINDSSNMFFLQKVNPGNASRGKIVFDVNDSVINDKELLMNVQTGFWGTEQGTIKVAK